MVMFMTWTCGGLTQAFLTTSDGITRRRAPTVLLPCFCDGVGHMELSCAVASAVAAVWKRLLRDVEGQRLKCGDGDIIMWLWRRVGGWTVYGGATVPIQDVCVIWSVVGG